MGFRRFRAEMGFRPSIPEWGSRRFEGGGRIPHEPGDAYSCIRAQFADGPFRTSRFQFRQARPQGGDLVPLLPLLLDQMERDVRLQDEF